MITAVAIVACFDPVLILMGHLDKAEQPPLGLG